MIDSAQHDMVTSFDSFGYQIITACFTNNFNCLFLDLATVADGEHEYLILHVNSRRFRYDQDIFVLEAEPDLAGIPCTQKTLRVFKTGPNCDSTGSLVKLSVYDINFTFFIIFSAIW